jgi:hypothetical protein
MRILGAVLLFFGFLLCVSIAWAAIGFFMMGFGLICFLIVDERNKRSERLAGRRFDLSRVDLREPTASRALRDEKSSATTFDEQNWNFLVQNDPDLARIVEALTPYGQKYVDQLARAYLVLDDKDYLPIILDKIVGSARKDASRQSVERALTAATHCRTETADSDAGRVSAPELQPVHARQLQALYRVVKGSSAVTLNSPHDNFDLKSEGSTPQVVPGHAAGVPKAAVRPELRLVVDFDETGDPALNSSKERSPSGGDRLVG